MRVLGISEHKGARRSEGGKSVIHACKACPLRPYLPPPRLRAMADRAFHPHPRSDLQLSWWEGEEDVHDLSLGEETPYVGSCSSIVRIESSRLPRWIAFTTGLFPVSSLSINPIEREETEVDWTASPIQPECGSEGTGGREPTRL